jgi:plasmid stabilization system protein ParE
MQIAFHAAAREEAREAFLRLKADDPQMADDFETRLRLAIAAIEKHPAGCHERKYGVRRKNLARFKRHYVAYMVWNEMIVVIAVGHASRRPYYWYRRPKDYRRNPTA